MIRRSAVLRSFPFALRLGPLIACFAALATVPPAAHADDSKLWELLRSEGHFALMRHALAPGVGDPSTFVLEDCDTQRNLSQTGREQARRLGERFRENGIASAHVYSSQWCRCLETARLLEFGPVTELPALNSFFQTNGQRDAQTSELRAWIALQSLQEPTVLVSHQVNITALTGIYPSSGELLVVRRRDSGELEVAGSIKTE